MAPAAAPIGAAMRRRDGLRRRRLGRRAARRGAAATALLAAGLAVAGCGVSGTWVRADLASGSAEEVEPALLDARLLLVGDAGEPRRDGPEPVLQALARQASLLPAQTVVVFLGDNIYPSGLPPLGHRSRSDAERRLRAQAETVGASGARTLFIPGNHDYALDGWAGLKRQIDFLAGLGLANVEALPRGGCPGPEVVDLGTRLRLVLLDSQWWLQDGPKPRHPDSPCPTDSEDEIVTAVQEALATGGGRRAVVLAHHPLATHGEHGGAFGWLDHLFPLREVHAWLWVPLPGLGSLYPFLRQHGITEQDLSSRHYGHLRARLEQALAARPPLAWAAGHEHTLQVLEGRSGPLHVVSGAGSMTRPEFVARRDDTWLASVEPGFVQLDVRRDGRVRLEVFTVRDDASVGRPLARWLDD
jgi:hypothetical protein